MVLIVECDGDVPRECRAARANINCYVEHTSLQHSHKLALGLGILEMQPSKYAVGGTRKIVLNEGAGDAMRCVTIASEAFVKEAPLISKDLRLNDQDIGKRRFDDIHAGRTH